MGWMRFLGHSALRLLFGGPHRRCLAVWVGIATGLSFIIFIVGLLLSWSFPVNLVIWFVFCLALCHFILLNRQFTSDNGTTRRAL
jgi:hypothetical protein